MRKKIFAILAEDARKVVRDPSPLAPPLSAPGDVEAALAALDVALADIAGAATPNDFADAVGGFGTALADLGQAAAGAAVGAAEPILVRMLQERLPRLAAVLALAGAITPVDANGEQDIDWSKLRDVFTDPAVIFDETLWDELLGDVGGEAEGRQIATLLALIILFPQTVIALFNRDISIAGLTAPETRAPGLWRNFRDRTQAWISVTLPLPDPAASAPTPGSLLDITPGLAPDIAATLAGMATRRLQGGLRTTDFEAWLALTVDQDVWEYEIGDGWLIRADPGVAAGFGRRNGSWNAAFRALAGDPSFVPAPGEPWRLSFLREAPQGEPDILLGPPFDTRIEIRDFLVYLEVRAETPIVKFAMEIDDLAMVLSNRWLPPGAKASTPCRTASAMTPI